MPDEAGGAGSGPAADGLDPERPTVLPADVVFLGTAVTMDPARPRATAVAVRDGRIVGVGGRADAHAWTGPDTRTVELGDRCLLPGFVEAHGHAVAEARLFGTDLVDIRPMTVPTPDDVVDTIRKTLAARGAEGAAFIGWDTIGHGHGLPEPTLAWLDAVSPDAPLVILTQSAHLGFFNTRAAERAGVDRTTPDPPGARFGRSQDGTLLGTAYEAGAIRRLFPAAGHPREQLVAALRREVARLNQVGVTTISEMACLPEWRDALLDPKHRLDGLSLRLRLYSPAGKAPEPGVHPGEGDDLIREVGVKIWVDGSPWVGTIAVSFPYLDTELTRSMGLGSRPRTTTNYSWDALAEVVEAYFPLGWQIACHAHGDLAIDMVLDVYESVLSRYRGRDHRLRLEHVGAMRQDQFVRAAALGVTASVFIDHVYYWGEVLTDDLFGEKYGAHWAAARSAVDAGMRISLHNDPPATPEDPLHNITVAATRRSRQGRVMAPEECLTVEQALRAETIDAAYQLLCDDITGSLTPGKYADLVVLSANPLEVPPEDVRGLEVLATFLAGRQVHGAPLA
ncbi:amidohydrolase [Yinghuangia seranimata]|uniref:amidohydrolase n=1 Tax=Yinghuangia seranimata TaxID=408067 RepID=UPI00248BF428|nr:amidohydrolase [Yinghuangia seranimata]MDI2127301.1 amidohydrolase [Yinghuangia seranimata]